MSDFLVNVRKRVRFHLRDRNPARQVFSSFELNVAIEDAMQTVAGETKLGQSWVTGVAISNASDTVTVSSTLEISQLLRVRLTSNKTDLRPITREQFERLRAGETDPSGAGAGDPQDYVPYEGPDQKLKLQLYPWPRATDALELLQSTLPITLTDDSAILPFDKHGIRATAQRAAGMVLATASDEILARLGLSRDAGPAFLQMAQRAEKQSRLRRGRVGQHAHTRRSRSY